jgi:hypothetical protein
MAQIASVMTAPGDYQAVLRFLKITCKTSKKVGDAAVQSINRSVVRITSSALIAEFTKSRDLIQSLGTTPLCNT